MPGLKASLIISVFGIGIGNCILLGVKLVPWAVETLGLEGAHPA